MKRLTLLGTIATLISASTQAVLLLPPADYDGEILGDSLHACVVWHGGRQKMLLTGECMYHGADSAPKTIAWVIPVAGTPEVDADVDDELYWTLRSLDPKPRRKEMRFYATGAGGWVPEWELDSLIRARAGAVMRVMEIVTLPSRRSSNDEPLNSLLRGRGFAPVDDVLVHFGADRGYSYTVAFLEVEGDPDLSPTIGLSPLLVTSEQPKPSFPMRFASKGVDIDFYLLTTGVPQHDPWLQEEGRDIDLARRTQLCPYGALIVESDYPPFPLAETSATIRDFLPDVAAESGGPCWYVTRFYGDVNTGPQDTTEWSRDFAVELNEAPSSPSEATPPEGVIMRPSSMAAALAPRNLALLKEYVEAKPGDVSVKQDGGDLSIHLASRAGWLAGVEFLLEHGADLEAVNSSGSSALVAACEGGHHDVAEYLIQRGLSVRPSPGSRSDQKALVAAVRSGNAELVRLLIEAGAQPSAAYSGGVDLLQACAAGGSVDIAELLVAKGGRADRHKKAEESPLYLALENGHFDLATWLQERFPEQVSHDRSGRTCLHVGAEAGKAEIVTWLLRHGYDPNAGTRAGQTALHVAARNGHTRVVEILLETGANPHVVDGSDSTALHAAAEAGNKGEAVARLLIEHGVDPSATNRHGRTAMDSAVHAYAARNDRDRMISLLAEKGVKHDVFYLIDQEDVAQLKDLLEQDPEVVHELDHNKNTPLHRAASENQVEIAKLLISAGARVNYRHGGGSTPISRAVAERNTEMVTLLIEHGADPGLSGPRSHVPIHEAVKRGRTEMVLALLGYEGAAGITNRHGATPLHVAAAGKSKDIVRILLEAGADISARDKTGDSPLHYAARSGSIDIVRLLLLRGADAGAEGSGGVTPTALASDRGHRPIVELLMGEGGEADIFTALASGKEDQLHVILTSDPSAANAVGPGGRSPLHWSALRGLSQTAALLLTKGADPNGKDANGQTPLHVALAQGHEDLVGLLLEKGADPNGYAGQKMSPLHLAVRRRELDAVRALMAAGANVNLPDEQGKLPLSIALNTRSREIAEALVVPIEEPDSGVDLFPVKMEGLWGHIDSAGRVRIVPQFQEVPRRRGRLHVVESTMPVSSFSEGLAPVTHLGKWGFVDKTGKIVIPPRFEAAMQFSGGLAPVKSGGTWSYIDRTGKYVSDDKYTMALPFSEGFAVVGVGTRESGSPAMFGFVGPDGTWAFDAWFDEAGHFRDGLAPVKLEGKYGYVNRRGRMKIKPVFEMAFPFSEGLARVRTDDIWTYINTRGRPAFRPSWGAEYRPSGPAKTWQHYPADFCEGLAFVGNAFIDKTGSEVISGGGSVRLIGGFSDGLAPFSERRKNHTLPFVGFTDLAGTKRIEPERPSRDTESWRGRRIATASLRQPIQPYSQGLTRVFGEVRLGDEMLDRNPRSYRQGARSQPQRGFGYMDTSGRIVIEPQYQWSGRFHEGLALVVNAETVSVIDRTGATVVRDLYRARPPLNWDSPETKDVLRYSEGLVPVRIDGAWGYADTSGAVVIKPRFDAAMVFAQGLAPVKEGGKWGYVDRQGKMKITPQFTSAGVFADGRAPVSIENSEPRRLPDPPHSEYRSGEVYGFIDQTGEMVIPAIYDTAESFSDGRAQVGVGPLRRSRRPTYGHAPSVTGKYGYVDVLGNVVIPIQYTQAQSFSEGKAWVMIGAKFADSRGPHEGAVAVIDTRGRFLVAPRIEAAGRFAEGLVPVMIGGRWGYFSKKGNLVIPPVYDWAGSFRAGLAPVRRGDALGYIDQTGREIWRPTE